MDSEYSFENSSSADIEREFDRLVAGMEWDEVVATLYEVIEEQMRRFQPPPPPPPSLSLPDLIQQHQFVSPLGEHGNSQECLSVPNSAPPQVPEQSLNPVGYLHNQPDYGMVPEFYWAAGPSHPTLANNRKSKTRTAHPGDNLPYTKMPKTAFMIFRKEQFPKVMGDFKIEDSSVVNAIVDKMWRLLPEEEKVVYYDKARVEKELHSQQHPGWSAAPNYSHSETEQCSGTWTPPSQGQKLNWSL